MGCAEQHRVYPVYIYINKVVWGQYASGQAFHKIVK